MGDELVQIFRHMQDKRERAGDSPPGWCDAVDDEQLRSAFVYAFHGSGTWGQRNATLATDLLDELRRQTREREPVTPIVLEPAMQTLSGTPAVAITSTNEFLERDLDYCLFDPRDLFVDPRDLFAPRGERLPPPPDFDYDLFAPRGYFGERTASSVASWWMEE